jgi:hypothetical protein
MKVKDILDYFGPQITCLIKFKRKGQDNYCFETTGDKYSDDEIFLESYIVQINMTDSFIELVIEGEAYD